MTTRSGSGEYYPWVPDTSWTVLKPYWEGLAKGELLFPKCEHCGHFQWYPEPACDSCQSDRFKWTALEPRGTIYSYTVVRRSLLVGFEPPIIIALAAMDDAPNVRLLTNIIDCSPDDISIGVSVDIARREVSPGVFLPFARLFDPARLPAAGEKMAELISLCLPADL
jgi:uncharacterized protein